jgi:hypothetical protein
MGEVEGRGEEPNESVMIICSKTNNVRFKQDEKRNLNITNTISLFFVGARRVVGGVIV